MSNNIISIVAILLIFIIIIILITVKRWNLENEQLHFWDAIRYNVNAFSKIIFEGKDESVVPTYAVYHDIKLLCSFMVKMSLFMMHNHGPNPCDIDYIKINNRDISNSMFVNEKDLRL